MNREHDTQDEHGENMGRSKGYLSMAEAPKNWIEEKYLYHGEAIGEGNFSKYGYYTQVGCNFGYYLF